VGIAIAGTLLATTILSTTAHRRQLRQCVLKQQAIEAVDVFLSKWSRHRFDSGKEAEALSQSRPEFAIGIGVTARIVSTQSDLNIEVVRIDGWHAEDEQPLHWVEIVRQRKAAP
jgi:hypothetical protein